MRGLILPISLLLSGFSFAQNIDVIIRDYDRFKEPTIVDRRFKHSDIVPLIERLKSHSEFTVKEEGKSMEGRTIYSVSVGTGPISVLMWSQMHGNETTATQSIMDLFNLLKSDDHSDWKEDILSKVTLTFIPMLNPDGAERFRRHTALNVDLNRDALRLQTPEANILKNKRDELDADFGFNLHDQNRRTSVGDEDFPASISFLAPAYNVAKVINEVRGNSMKLIALLNRALQQHIPNQVAKYDDTFEPRAFGDNIQKWGTSTILIESGGNRNDRDKQVLRKMNFIALLTSFEAIANGTYANEDIADYEAIPFNQHRMNDLLIKNATVEKNGKPHTLDIGITQRENDYNGHRKYFLDGYMNELGDLSTYYGYKVLDATDMTAAHGKVHPKVFTNAEEVAALDFGEQLKNGITYYQVKNLPDNGFTDFPGNLVPEGWKPNQDFVNGNRANMVFSKGGAVTHAVVCGYLLDLSGSLEAKGLVVR